MGRGVERGADVNDRSTVPGWPDWLGLVVEDLDAARRFYADVLGREPVATGDDWVQFDLGDHRIVEVLRRDAERVQYERARFQPGFPVDDLAAARDRLVGLGAEQVSEVEGGPEHGGLWCYFRDPQGHVFELTQPIPPRSTSAARAPADELPDGPPDGLHDGLR
jgi:catechol 2,3-dioxygenase-like lactoylglutathione lyase family enzyme